MIVIGRFMCAASAATSRYVDGTRGFATDAQYAALRRAANPDDAPEVSPP